MTKTPSDDAGLVRYVIIGVVAGMFIGPLIGLLVPSIGVGFGIALGLTLGILGATVAWFIRRPTR
jgi:fucose permease